MGTLAYIFRFFVLLALGVIGMAMAVTLMVSTAIAIGILFVIAKIKGRPFGARAYWNQRTSRTNFSQNNFNNYRKATNPQVIDVEVKEVN